MNFKTHCFSEHLGVKLCLDIDNFLGNEFLKRRLSGGRVKGIRVSEA